jgi:hypothetical protein
MGQTMWQLALICGIISRKCTSIDKNTNRSTGFLPALIRPCQMKPISVPPTSSNADPAEQAVAAVLQPLARLMIDQGLQHAQVSEILKAVLVHESVAQFGLEERAVSDTRVALLTGVHRKDVKRLRAQQPSHSKAAKQVISVPAAVIARWISEPRFLNIDQSPRALAKSPKSGTLGEPDFPTLVAEVSRDVSARAVLDELLRLGAVEIRPPGQVALLDQAFVPHGSPADQLEFLGASVGDHLRAAVHNVSPKRAGKAMLDQSAFSQDLSAEQVAELHQHARKLWTGVLQKFLSAATLAEQRSQTAVNPTHRVRFGVYFYEQDQGALPDVGAPIKPARRTKRLGRDT